MCLVHRTYVDSGSSSARRPSYYPRWGPARWRVPWPYVATALLGCPVYCSQPSLSAADVSVGVSDGLTPSSPVYATRTRPETLNRLLLIQRLCWPSMFAWVRRRRPRCGRQGTGKDPDTQLRAEDRMALQKNSALKYAVPQICKRNRTRGCRLTWYGPARNAASTLEESCRYANSKTRRIANVSLRWRRQDRLY